MKNILYSLYGWLLLVIIALILLMILPCVFILRLFFNSVFEKTLSLASRIFLFLFFPLTINVSGVISPPEKGTKRMYVVSHGSRLDGVLLSLLPGRIFYLMKDKDAAIPVFGWIIKWAGHVLLPKNTSLHNSDGIIDTCRHVFEKGGSFLIFPEGTRSRDGQIGRFHTGAFILAKMCGADLYPVIFDTYKVLPRGKIIFQDFKVNIHFLKPVLHSEMNNKTPKELSTEIKNEMIGVLKNKRSVN
ncbi:MAG: hypothetical protein A2015_11005 [Spirochaetes bacterium GWF1_31_7]|nr:MAG: hypothetical protein A2Y30_13140 [Spirochaetes bacterium GWE1_32_154]OHD48386.1 MAG: hypothetical protein A2015_11005 [Spirochaetes bacterium GWF1_31_7]OHD50479.1 MAG: hypothetical protein A2Y29_11185 [Spirochaetes bacterium GWE2_31_10]OHD82653.1 MAG: hypothetical protein A2355_15125 [Spirochaetes bacterium RIFOXYB1_FULL_32_8]HBD93238.1 hypothetical protein [Spirochaetia bacterium]